MTNIKITKKALYNAIATYFTTNEDLVIEDGITSADVVAFTTKEIANLVKKAEYAKSKAATKKTDGDELRAKVLEALSEDEFQIIADIAAKVEGEDVTVAKVTNRLSNLVKAGLAESTEVTVGEPGAKRKIKAYRAVVAD